MCRVYEDHGLLSRFRRRINGAGPVLLAGAAVLLYVATFASLRLGDGGIFTHLAAGDRIVDKREIPRNEPFSYAAPGLRWLEETWVFDLVAAGLRALGGLRLLQLATAAAAIALFLFLFRRGLRRGPPALVAAALLLLATACRERLLPGPEVVSWWLLALCLTALSAALESAEGTLRRRVLWLGLPGAVLVWANVQSWFVLVPLLTCLALLAEAGRAAPVVDLLVSMALQCVAALVNPYGAQAVRLPFDRAMASSEVRELVGRAFPDWRPLLSGSLVQPPVAAALVLAGLALLSIVVRPRRTAAWDVLVLFAFALLGFRARVFLPFVAIAATIVLLRHLEARLPGPALLPSAVVALAALGLGFQALRPVASAPPDRVPLPGLGLAPGDFPQEAAQFVVHAGIPGQVFHSLSIGGFLVDAWKRDRLVFMDDRVDPFLHGALATYLQMLADPEAFERAADKYQITAVLWPHRDAAAARPLLRHLATGSRWVLADLDLDAAIWVRGDVLSPMLVAHEPVAPGKPPSAVAAMLEKQIDEQPAAGPPRREARLAEFFEALEDPAGAERFLKRALARQPRSAPLWAGYGEVLETLGRREEALGADRAALRLDPRSARALGALGAILEEDGHAAEALRVLDAAWAAGDRRGRTLEARSRLLEAAGRGDEAGRQWDEALHIEEPDRDLLLGGARFRARHGDTEGALGLYARARHRAPDDAVLAKENAELLESAGRGSEALEALRGPAEGAADRLAGAGAGPLGAGAGPLGAGTGNAARREDRELLVVAARLARRAGEEERARAWEAAVALSRSH
jgi:tetratricopeptide (TPR) repeat protein